MWGIIDKINKGETGVCQWTRPDITAGKSVSRLKGWRVGSEDLEDRGQSVWTEPDRADWSRMCTGITVSGFLAPKG
jgi:hypothetical protein